MRDLVNKYLAGAALAAGLALVPGVVFAQAEAAESVDGSEEELDEIVDEELESDDVAEKPWSVSAAVMTRIYQGVFAGLENPDDNLSSPHAKDPSHAFDRWLNIYVLGGGYTLDDFSFGAEVMSTHWMTPGGGHNGPYEFRIEDAGVSASWSGYKIEPIDTTVAASYELGIPLSATSRATGLQASNSLGVSLSRTFFDKLSLKYGLGGGWLIHEAVVPTGDAELVGIFRENERLADNQVAIGGTVNTQFSLSNSLSASIPVWDKLRASVSYSFSKYWSYHRENDDEFKSPREGVQSGRATSDMVAGSVGLSYPVGDYVKLGAGLRSVQPPKTADNKSFRFPWWNFEGPNASAGNVSAVQFSVSGSY